MKVSPKKVRMTKREWSGHYGERWSNGVRDWVAHWKETGGAGIKIWFFNCSLHYMHVHLYTILHFMHIHLYMYIS